MLRRSLLLLSLVASPAAGDFLMSFPLDCTLDETCYIQQFVDHDPSAGVSDFACGTLTYDGHKGTDYALPSLADQAKGVAVLAAADGTVMGVRNDMDDVLQVGENAPDVSNRECGNGVVIQHGAGYETQYCHMARGSVTVKSGQVVTAGTPLGMVGLSGQTQFPHLHISVRKDGQVIDPFNADGQQTCPDTTLPSLWDAPMATPAGGIVNVGLAEAVPDFDSVKAGTADIGAASNGPAMVAWVHLFGPRSGDVLRTKMVDPNGDVAFENTEVIARDQARAMRAVGKRTPRGGWATGVYELTVLHARGDETLDTQVTRFSVD